jgi:hypothetical protein
MTKSAKYILVFLVAVAIFFVFFYRRSEKDGVTNTSSHPEKILMDGNTACSDVVAGLATESGILKYSGKIKPINFNSLPEAKLFKTTISNSYKEGANFAGQYNLAFWGCGTDCVGFSVTDITTGNIIEYSPINESYHLGGYEVGNRLIVFNPVNSGMERKIYRLSESDQKVSSLELVCSEISQEDMYPNPEQIISKIKI